MKAILIKLAVLLIFTGSLAAQPAKTFKLGFTGAYPHNYNYDVTSTVEWSWYRDELNMNMWSGWWIGETRPAVLTKLNDYNIDGLFQPDTIRWAGLGRQVILEAEETDDRFSYSDHHSKGTNYRDGTQWGSNQLVRYYQALPTGPYDPVTVLSEAKENTVQSFCAFPYDPMYQVPFPYNNYYHPEVHRDTTYMNTYYIKPRMRIKVNDANGPVKNVAKIIVKAYNGIDNAGEFIIQTRDFLDANGQYDGRYLEDYYQLEIWVFGDIINTGRPGPWPWGQLENCHVDYQIQWYGEVDVWIDYVKVQDEAAYRLLNPNPIINSKVRDAIKQKINELKYNDQGKDRMKGFYMEEIDYYNLGCLKFLNDNLPVWANDADYKVIGLVAWWSYNITLKNRLATDYRDYFTEVNPPFFMCAEYPFQNPGFEPVFSSRLPNNLTYADLSNYPRFVRDAFNQFFYSPSIVVSTTVYNTHTQTIWEAYADSIKAMMNLCTEFNKDLYLVPQVHYYMEIVNGEYYLVHKEPMNSEIGGEFCIAICHGAKGIIPYAYESSYWNRVGAKAVHTYGITDFTEQNNWGHARRTSNFYGENKWLYMQNLYGKMKIWGPMLANSPATEGYSVNPYIGPVNKHFIYDIVSIDPRIQGQNPCVPNSPPDVWYDCLDQRYWEIGFFYPNYLPPNDKSQYFMMVNKRCVPDINNDGDIRQLKIKFNSQELQASINWKIIDVYDESAQPVTFSRNYSGYVDLGFIDGTLGYFHPGEGKLFKLVPVIQ